MTIFQTGSTMKSLSAIIAAILFSPLIATAKPSPLLLNEKIQNLETILTHAAKEKSDQAEFGKIHQLLKDAGSALKSDDLATAEKLYSNAWDAYRASVKAAQTQSHQTNERKNLAARMASVKALLNQFEEISKEHSDEKKTGQIENIKSLLAQADAAEDIARIRTLANQAYYLMKILMKETRDGKTLTFDHTFATPALKYADETAYNDMHFGLLDTALEQFQAQADAAYNDLVKGAKKLREQAEEAAKHNDYESAMRDLAHSTAEIKKALKHLGLAIPGL